jgi:DNA-binding MarR family transcriptional regulator
MDLLCGIDTKEKIKMNPIANLNKAFDHRIRLGIMSSLLINHEMNFNELKELLELTDGNLATHLKTLEEFNYIVVRKGFIGKKTNTTYLVTKLGKEAFQQHLNNIEKLIKGI